MSKVSDIDEDDPLLQRTRALATEVAPPADLWPGIRNRLFVSGHGRRPSAARFRSGVLSHGM